MRGIRGSETYSAQNAFLRLVKARVRKGPAARSLLRSRHIVVRLQADVPHGADPAGWDCTASAVILENMEFGPSEVWAHIGTHSLSPCRSCFRKLAVAADRDPVVESAVELEATHVCARVCAVNGSVCPLVGVVEDPVYAKSTPRRRCGA